MIPGTHGSQGDQILDTEEKHLVNFRQIPTYFISIYKQQTTNSDMNIPERNICIISIVPTETRCKYFQN